MDKDRKSSRMDVCLGVGVGKVGPRAAVGDLVSRTQPGSLGESRPPRETHTLGTLFMA